ncbi:MAG: hypothetical protein Q4A03_06560 [Rothia sp. (in: high G+C Gram-positive bacteria)]|uniref:hypothetical protein n=1 Tax=Rothia sp. (in: high G+C Gram-positive bacteria) TaxID=1885016 RepID=UPI0027089A0A|nr:hypothetical protein [Rothia sp. (in: high G+C Gram-positive bacteria)]
MGLFSRKKTQAPAPATDATQRDVLATGFDAEQASAPATAEPTPVTQPASTRLGAGEGLKAVVKLMRAKAEGQVTLNLTQNANDMKYTLYQRGQEVESGLVTPGSEWFQAVADLYVEEEKSERGAWNRALVVVNPAIGSDAAVHASFMNTATSKTHNLNYALDMGAAQPQQDAKTEQNGEALQTAETQQSTEAQQVAEAEKGQDTAPAPAIAPAGTTQGETAAQAEDRMSRISARLAQEKAAQEQAAQAEAAKAESTAEEVSDTAEEVAVEPAKEETVEETSAAAVSSAEAVATEEVAAEESPADVAPAADSTSQQGAVSAAAASNYPATARVRSEADAEAPAETSAEAATGQEEQESQQLPAHLDDSEFETEDQPQASAAPAQASSLPASAPAPDAPMTSTSVDIAPSYAEHSQPKPSATKKASGNLVLTEAEVVSRLAPAYEALFGAAGTARDVSTVLIRVRTLGSYYDALTHVRRNGFWEQVRTFDLIPEETLAILQLKADSYKEGHGSPLAINIRFTPGTPVEATFDYADEEAFVRYPEHLPAQQYVEELRMFPRTGENIPAHMNEALASWTF